MSFVCDFHVHLYPCYELDSAFDAAARNLSSHNAETKALCLTERHDCHYFQRLAEQDPTLPLCRWRAEQTSSAGCLRIISESGDEIYLFAGRQVATSERLELLALLVDAQIPDRTSFHQAKESALQQGALPVLNWALGKWMFGRRAIVERILRTANRGELAICDTSLRPKLWPEPKLMRLAQDNGFPLLVGSDPLPFTGEEQLIGSYAFKSSIAFDPVAPVASLRRIIEARTEQQTVGARSGTASTIRRNITLLRQR